MSDQRGESMVAGVGRPTPTPPFQRPLLQKFLVCVSWLLSFAGCVGLLCMSVVRGNVSAMFITGIAVFGVGLIPLLRLRYRDI